MSSEKATLNKLFENNKKLGIEKYGAVPYKVPYELLSPHCIRTVSVVRSP